MESFYEHGLKNKNKKIRCKNMLQGTWVAQLVRHLLLAWVVIPGSWDKAPHQASVPHQSPC